MPLDAYSLCPGGTGKKIKHCSCRDIVADLEQISRSLEGGQQISALNQINRVLTTHANRPCLLALKASALIGTSRMQDLEETIATFLQVTPENPLALGYATILKVLKKDVLGAVETLQQGLSHVEDAIPRELYDAIGIVGDALVSKGFYMAGRAHLLLRAAISGDEQALKSLFATSGIPQIPPSLKADFHFPSCPDGVAWRERFQKAVTQADHGVWRVSSEQLIVLDKEVPDRPEIVKSIAIALTSIADPQASDVWHRYAALESAPEEEAVEAEAVAQLLDSTKGKERVEVVRVTRSVSDAKALMEQLLSSKQTVSSAVNPAQWNHSESVPPKGIFLVLDRPKPAADDDLTIENIPRLIGQLALFGKQTDRDARLETVVTKTCDYDRIRETLNEVVGELAGEVKKEEVIQTGGRIQSEVVPLPYFCPEVPAAKQRELSVELLQQSFLDQWPNLALDVLDGKTPLEVAGDPSYRVRLIAAVLVLEQLAEQNVWPIDFEALRSRLGLPEPEPIDPATISLQDVPPVRWQRIEVETLEDDDLLSLLNRATVFGLGATIMLVAQEMLRRETLKDKVDAASLYAELSRLSGDSDAKLEYIHKAQAAARDQGKSPAQWLLAEFPIRVLRQEGEEAQELLQRLQTQHFREPGIAESTYNILTQMGLIKPEQGPGQGQPQGPAEQAVPDQAEEPGRLWTPDQGTQPPPPPPTSQPAPEAKKESKLWVPGMD